MNKTIVCTLIIMTAALLFCQIPSAEARRCHSTCVSLNVGACTAPDTYVVRRCPRPVVVAPVYAAPMYAAPVYATPVYPTGPAYPYCAPVPVYAYPPAYVEEVYVAPRRPCLCPGLSFSWNFFR